MPTGSGPTPISAEAEEVLDLLRLNHNVLISGPPGTGKSRLLADVARGFLHQVGGPALVKTNRIAIPANSAGPPPPYLPSPHRAEREVFSTVMHSGSKPRDFLRGIVPAITPGGDHLEFEVTRGTLYRASQHALGAEGAALLMIDELNRGPAVAVFGPSIVAIESDKRLDDGGNATSTTQTFELLDDKGHPLDYALPTHMYIVAAMNQADTSVEALDVAFLRRFAPYKLSPSTDSLLAHFHLATADMPAGPPSSAAEVYSLLVLAWAKVNARLTLGRGPEYQIGHGVLMLEETAPVDYAAALAYAARGWQKVRQHLDEVFFGDTRGVGELLAAGRPGSPYTINDTTFAGQPVVQLVGPEVPDDVTLLGALRAIAES